MVCHMKSRPKAEVGFNGDTHVRPIGREVTGVNMTTPSAADQARS